MANSLVRVRQTFGGVPWAIANRSNENTKPASAGWNGPLPKKMTHTLLW